MTKATSETTKLNFITDQGSTRAMVRWACRDERFDDALCRVPPGGSPAGEAFAGATLTGGVRGGAEVLAVVLERRKFRAGEDGEVGSGSGVSHANEAAETVGSEAGDAAGAGAGAGSERSVPTPVANAVPSSGHPVPVGVSGGSFSAGAGSASGVAIEEDKPSLPSVQSSSATGPMGAATDRLKPRLDESRGVPIVSAGNAGTWSAAASFSSAAAPLWAGPALAGPALAGAELPLARTSLAAAAARATFCRAARTAEVAMIWVSSSVSAIRSSSSSCCAVTTVGEAPPEPSDVFVRLSKPSSYDLTLMRVSLDRTPKGHSCQEDGFVPILRDNVTLIRTLETGQSLPST